MVPTIMKSFWAIKSSLLTFVSGRPILNKVPGKSHLCLPLPLTPLLSRQLIVFLQDKKRSGSYHSGDFFKTGGILLSQSDSGGKWRWDVNFQAQKLSCPSRHFLWKHQSIRGKESPVAGRCRAATSRCPVPQSTSWVVSKDGGLTMASGSSLHPH